MDTACDLRSVSLRRGDVHLWLRVAESALPGDGDLLSDDERASADRRVFDEDRSRYIAAHAVLRRVLSAYASRPSASLRFEARDGGKPFLADQDLHFNMSHSGGLVAIAVAGEEVGIDVERVDRPIDADAIAARFFTADEQRWLRGQPAMPHAFFRLWTIKEALMKADGRGMAIPLAQLAVDTSTLGIDAPVRCHIGGAPWLVREVAAGDRVCVSVARRTDGRVRLCGPLPRLPESA
jgi:4'-phosphopantetheinyl transferase